MKKNRALNFAESPVTPAPAVTPARPPDLNSPDVGSFVPSEVYYSDIQKAHSSAKKVAKLGQVSAKRLGVQNAKLSKSLSKKNKLIAQLTKKLKVERQTSLSLTHSHSNLSRDPKRFRYYCGLTPKQFDVLVFDIGGFSVINSIL